MTKVLYTKSNQLFIDAVLAAAAWVFAHLIRFEGVIPHSAAQQMILMMIPIAAGQVVMNAALGIYKFQWRYVNTGDALCIGRSYAAYSALLMIIDVVAGRFRHGGRISLSILVTAAVLSFVGAVSARLARRILYERRESAPEQNSRPQTFLIIGAGMHGAMVAREMRMRRGIDLIGFLDDDPGKQKAVIAGRTVLGPISKLAQIVKERNVDEVLVCIPPKGRSSIRINDARTSKGLPVRSRVMPTLEEILQTDSVISVFPGMNEPAGTDLDSRELRSRRRVRETAHTNATSVIDVHRNRDGNSNGNGKAVSQSGEDATSTYVVNSKVPATFPTNKSILITGGAGFIGSSLAEKLVETNQLILLDQSFEQGPIQYTSLLPHPNVTTIRGSILETDLQALVGDVDIVVHAAAILGVNRVCSAGRETLETNYVGTSRLLKALDTAQKLERFVYFSTSEVFGVNSYRVDEASRPTIGPIAESRWSYAMSKLAGEHLVASYFRETQLPIAIVRPFNIFGPRRTGDYALRRFIVNALRGEPLQIHGDGTQIRSWCYIEDFCSALIQMMFRPEAIGEDFNIGHPGNTLTIYELAQKVIQLSGSNSVVTFCDAPFPDISIRVPSLEKAKRLLGYEPRYDLNTGLSLTIKWHQETLNVSHEPNLVSQMTAEALLGQSAA